MSKQVKLKDIEIEYDKNVVIFCNSNAATKTFKYSEHNLKTCLKYFYKALYLPITIEKSYMWIIYEKDCISRPLLYNNH
jgi:hypothetical protein